jgi:hypothetical protein
LVARFWRGRVAPALEAFAAAVAAFAGQVWFRISLAFDVLAGRMPRRTDKRPWVRSVEAPILADVRDWTTDRLIFSVLVWPPLEADGRDACRIHRGRAEEVMGPFARGPADKAWSTYWEVDHGLLWVHEREVWVDGDGHAYDGSRFGIGGRPPRAA